MKGMDKMSVSFYIKNKKKLFGFGGIERVLNVEEALLISENVEQFTFSEEEVSDNPELLKNSLEEIYLIMGIYEKSFRGFELHYEGEISFLIQQGKISAVGFGLDLTNRELQSELKSKGLPWERAKAFNGAAVMSSFVSIKANDIDKLSLQLWINGVLVQEGGVELMIYKPSVIIEEINSFLTLEDNDIVMSGTPKGVGSYMKGDIFVGKIFIDKNEVLSQEWIAR